MCEKYGKYESECNISKMIQEYGEYLSKWRALKNNWINANSTDRLRLYSSGQGSANVSITYFLEFFNRDGLCLGFCKPGLDSRFLKIYRLSGKKELYYVDEKTDPCDVKTASSSFSKLLEPNLDAFITKEINTEQDINDLLNKTNSFIKYYSPSQFLYKIIILNTIPENLSDPISHPMLFANSHAKINILLSKFGIKHKFIQRINPERFEFTNAFVMKYWSKLRELGHQNINTETPNIVQTEFMSWVCSNIYSGDLNP